MEVKVRLVPKKAVSTQQPSSFTSEMTHFFAKGSWSLDPSTSEDASFMALSAANRFSHSKARLTQSKRLEMTMDIDTAQSHFQTKMSVVEQSEAPDNLCRASLASFISSNEPLTVPDELKDLIAFAYLPTPPLLFNARFIPPKTSLHYLTLDTMKAILGASRCHRRGWTGKGVHVAMIDSGFANHPYFAVNGFNYNAIPTSQQPNPHTDQSGHGTGESANIFAMAPDIEFSGFKQSGSTAEDLESAIESGAKIITNSWGWDSDRQSWEELEKEYPNLYLEFMDIAEIISEASQQGVVFIFSAGNGHFAFPGSHPDVISAGGVTVSPSSTFSASSYASSFVSSLFPERIIPDVCGIVGESSQSEFLKGHIMLPVPKGSQLEGDNLPSSKSNMGWGIFSGTSAAAPQLAGAIALMQEARINANKPLLSGSQVKSILQSTAIDVIAGTTATGGIAGTGFDIATGAGLINAFDACIAATNY